MILSVVLSFFVSFSSEGRENAMHLWVSSSSCSEAGLKEFLESNKDKTQIECTEVCVHKVSEQENNPKKCYYLPRGKADQTKAALNAYFYIATRKADETQLDSIFDKAKRVQDFFRELMPSRIRTCDRYNVELEQVREMRRVLSCPGKSKAGIRVPLILRGTGNAIDI